MYLKNILLTIVGLLGISSVKYLPFVYFIRFYKTAIKYLYFTSPPKISSANKLDLFIEVRRSTYCCPLECDFFGLHKNNGTYQTELDFCRTETVLNRLQSFFTDFKKQTGRIPYVPLATYSISFLKEIKPFQVYHMDTRILTWDEKWLFTLSLFKVGDRIHSISVGKMVFKDGRKTIAPQEVIAACGYASDDVERVRLANFKYVTGFVDQTELLKAEFI
ncbi:hypothetical protein CANARDRAFT_6854 [[Candida] arabinofermentans NRRL YB-2248]|uniref:Thioesterase domain-containing protein n=1 Tax=[Candida] arabinofermentans NRRL YB-2248 TaxID=983967 RepID=A0A1E4T3Q1_9ASCO|nr:hypothetical protein CANARDRAFT_6854 [[Candida] arabinofermentans NRRL YB-2248]